MAGSAAVIPFPGPPTQRRGSGSQGPVAPQQPVQDDAPKKPLSKLKKAFTNAIAAKYNENAESALSERYFHGVQWTNEELKTLDDRRQPVITYNRIKRKINTITGIVEKLRQDPKAYPRNPQRQAEDGAEIATKVLNYALGWQWASDTSVTVARRTAVRGLSGVEMVLVDGDQGDPEIEWDVVDQRDFFYDPRSIKLDFSDARFMGTTRWIDVDEAVETWPEYEEELLSYRETSPTSEYDRGDERLEIDWVSKDDRKRVRIVDQWYMVGSQWHYAIYCGSTVLEFGRTYLKDEKGRDVHKYEMLSYEIDQDGDRYGAIRDLKSPQDEVNHRRSKALHQLNSRKIIADAGAVDDVETARREYARADGWVVKNKGYELIPEDQQANAVVQGNLSLLEEAKAEIDTYGPNPGLIGTDIPADSGRAIQLLQAAGIAELGSYMTAYRNWKLRVYRKTWNAVQGLWTAPRWIRVTDDENLAQFIQVNGWEQDPMTGQVKVLHELAALDVDIIIEEGPDQVSTMADTFDTLVQLGKGGAQIPPEMFIELSPLPSSQKQRILQQIQIAQQPKPMDQQAMMLQLGLLQAQIAQLNSQAQLNQMKGVQAQADAGKAQADAQATMVEAQRGPAQQIDTAADIAKANLDQAKATEIHHKIEVGAHVPEAKAPPAPPPGLFELNMAKAGEAHARSEAARAQAQATAQTGWSQLDTDRADRLVKLATADKLAAETRTIHEAPPGMLTKPPPRPPSVPSAGKKR